MALCVFGCVKKKTLGGWGVAWLEECLCSLQETPDLLPLRLGIVVCVCNLNTWETEAGELLQVWMPV